MKYYDFIQNVASKPDANNYDLSAIFIYTSDSIISKLLGAVKLLVIV